MAFNIGGNEPQPVSEADARSEIVRLMLQIEARLNPLEALSETQPMAEDLRAMIREVEEKLHREQPEP